MKKWNRVVAAALLLLMLSALIAVPVLAEGEIPTEPPSNIETTVPPPTVGLTRLRVIGSNQKIYPSSPGLAAGTNSYAFAVPSWMQEATFEITASKAVNITCDGAKITNSGLVYSVAVTFTNKSTTFTVNLADSNDTTVTRVLKLTINRDANRVARFESVTLMDKNSKTLTRTKESTDEAPVYELPAGTTEAKLKIIPRDESDLFIENQTKTKEGKFLDPNAADPNKPRKERLDLITNGDSKYYQINLTLVEGTNLIKLNVIGGDVSKERLVTIIVGDPKANEFVPETVTTSPTDVPTTAPTTEPTTAAAAGLGGGITPTMWILIAVIVVIILATGIFMIANVGGGSKKNRNSDDYYYDRDPIYNRDNRGGQGDYDYGYDEYDEYGFADPPPRQQQHRQRDLYDMDTNYDNKRNKPGRYEDYDDNY